MAGAQTFQRIGMIAGMNYDEETQGIPDDYF